MNKPLPKASVIIVSYNTRVMTLECLRSVYREAKSDEFEVIVLDNASSDASAEAIEAEFPAVKLIKSSENVGFARANNIASESATGTLLLLLNPDTVVLDGAIDRLLGFAAAHPDAGIWGGRTLFGDGTLNPTSCWRFMSLWSLFAGAIGLTAIFPNSPLFNPEGYGGWYRDSVREVDIVTGCFLLIERELWQRLGGFDTRYFMYGEEADLCYRARHFGARPLFTPEATIVHYDGASESVYADRIIRFLSAKVTLIKKLWPQPQKGVGLAFVTLAVLIRMVGYSVLSRAGSERHTNAAGQWRAIWSARRKWAKGYDSSESSRNDGTDPELSWSRRGAGRNT